jgi:hypothetical protein
MRIWITALCLLVTWSTGAQSSSLECDLTLNLKAPFVSCKGLRGYSHPDEWISDAQISYKTSDGKEAFLNVSKKVRAKDLLSEKGIAEILSQHGITNSSSGKVKKITIDQDYPLYKDAERSILASGCHMDGAPVVVAYDKKLSCQDYICIAAVECKFGAKREYKDAACKGEVSKEGVLCPSAAECLKDQHITEEEYIPAGTRKGGSKSSSSGANRQ